MRGTETWQPATCDSEAIGTGKEVDCEMAWLGPTKFWRAAAWGAMLLLVGSAALSPQARAASLTPESPEVLAAVETAVAYLQRADEKRIGGKALMALAVVKAGKEPDHPTIREGVQAIESVLEDTQGRIGDNYTIAIAIIFLSTLDPIAHADSIRVLVDALVSLQQPWGSWGYPSSNMGDTSMTQYGVLALWEAANAGVDVPIGVWERVANWFLRTQDPSGAFGYQAADPGSFELRNQSGVRHSMAAAGLGSVYICDNFLNLAGQADSGIDAVLKPVEARPSGNSKRRRRSTTKVSSSRIAKAQQAGDQWMRENYDIQPKDSPYLHYYLYTLERYESFREVSRRSRPASFRQTDDWYDDGARMLLATQSEQYGSWRSHAESGPACDTAFAILFLLRSTKKGLSDLGLYGGGTLAGGRGIPSGASELEMRSGRVVARALAGPADELLSMIGDEEHPERVRAIEAIGQKLLDADEDQLPKFERELRRLAGGTDPDARIAAVRGLARGRNLDNVPTLIFALTDPDVRVAVAADRSLRFISRKLTGVGFEVTANRAARGAVIKAWKEWYRQVRPSANVEQ